jgi:hypothetical protein
MDEYELHDHLSEQLSSGHQETAQSLSLLEPA